MFRFNFTIKKILTATVLLPMVAFCTLHDPYLTIPNHKPYIIHQTLTLKDAVFLALRYNPSIQNAELERIVQKFNLKVAENAFELQYALTGSSNFTRTKSGGPPATVAQSYSLTPAVSLKTQTGTTFNASMQNSSDGEYYNPGATVSLTQPLLRGSNPAVVLAPLHNAYDTELLNRVQLRSGIIDTIVQVITDYRSVISAEQALKIDKNSLKRAKINLENTRKFIEAGQKARMDLAQAKLTVTQNQITIYSDENTLAQARQTLLLDLGMNPDTLIKIDTQVKVKRYIPPSVKKSIKIALMNSPTYQEDLINLRIARRNLLVALDNARWQLNATVGATWGNGSGGPPNNNFRSIVNGQNQSQNASLSLTVPINDVQNQADIAGARVSIRQQQISRDLEKATIKSNVLNALRSLKIDWLSLQSAIEAERLQQINLENAYKQFKAGKIDSLSVSQQQDTLTQQEQAVLSSKIQYLNDVTSFRQLLQQTLHHWNIRLKF